MRGGVIVPEPMWNPARRYCCVVFLLLTKVAQRFSLLGVRQFLIPHTESTSRPGGVELALLPGACPASRHRNDLLPLTFCRGGRWFMPSFWIAGIACGMQPPDPHQVSINSCPLPLPSERHPRAAVNGPGAARK